MLRFLKLPTTIYKKLLLGYWLVIPACFYLYIALMAATKGFKMTELIVSIPGVTVGLMLVSLLLLQAYVLNYIVKKSQNIDGMLGKYLLFSLVQQICTGNILGAVLVFLYRRSIGYGEQDNFLKIEKIMIYTVMVIVGLFSLLVVFIAWRMKGS